MIQIAAPASNVPNATGRPAPVASGEGLLAFLLPGAEQGVAQGAAPGAVAGAETPAGERQADAAPGSDLPDGATDDLRFLAALLPGMPLPVTPEEKAELPAAGPVATRRPDGPKAARWTMPAISTIMPQPPVVAEVAPSLPAPVPDGRPVDEAVASTTPAPVTPAVPLATAALPAKAAGPETETALPASMPIALAVAAPAPVRPKPATEPSVVPAPVVQASRTMVADAIRAGVRIEPVPLPAAPVQPLAPIALPANWQAQAAPVIALASPVPLAVAADPVPAATPPVDGAVATMRPVAQPQPQPIAPVMTDPAAPPPPLVAATLPAGKDRDPAEPADPLATIAPAAAPQAITAVAPASGGERSMLDLTQERWPQAMVAHIERLRDAADAADTRIRLVPDALGAIDIGVRQEGETLHVHFTAAEAQTRTLLQEAQPRLAEAAEQRGLKLGQTSVGQNQADGSAGQRQPHSQPQHQAAPSPRPASPTRTASARDGDDDARLA